MVNLEGLKTGEFKGIMTKSVDMPLKDHLKKPEIIKKFLEGMKKENLPKRLTGNDVPQKDIDDYKKERMSQTVCVVYYTVDVNGEKRDMDEWFNIPSTGYGRSKIKAFRDINSLPFDTALWKDLPVKVFSNKDGYLKLIPE